jgi:hypothetical protein
MHKKAFLNASGRARVVFSHMRDFIDDRGGVDHPLPVDEWKTEFEKAEVLLVFMFSLNF